MSTASFEFADAGLRKYLKEVTDNVGDFKAKHKKIVDSWAVFIFKDVMDHFAKEEGPDGRWQKWTKAYETRSKLRGHTKILQDSGFLRNNFKHANYRKVPDGVAWFNDAQTKGGFPYAYAHDNDEAPRTRLPRRSFMWLSDKMLEKIAEVSLKFIAGD